MELDQTRTVDRSWTRCEASKATASEALTAVASMIATISSVEGTATGRGRI